MNEKRDLAEYRPQAEPVAGGKASSDKGFVLLRGPDQRNGGAVGDYRRPKGKKSRKKRV